jgi:hypothetical protein
LVTTVATPPKNCGRAAPSSGSDTPVRLTVVEKPGAYISSTLGANIRSQPTPASSFSASRASPRG